MRLGENIGRFVWVVALTLTACARNDWRTASRDSAGLAPMPDVQPAAVVQIYAARTAGWRGNFSVHSWIALKEKNAPDYQTYQVIGWRLRQKQGVIVTATEIPDRRWYGAMPELIRELVGAEAEAAIPKIKRAVAEYPYPHAYRAWPGPNSNTFVSFVMRRVPEFAIELPPHAIGKDWIDDGDLVGLTESRTGAQISLFGLLGLSVGAAEGIEANVLGLNFGIDFWRPALKLPLVGRLGFRDAPL